MSVLSTPEPRKRKFLPEEFRVTVWSKLKPYYHELERRPINAVSELERWIYDWNELSALFIEEVNWRYIRVSINTEDDNAKALYTYIIQRILPKVTEVNHLLNTRLLESPFKEELNKEQFGIFLRSIRNELELFQKDNVALAADIKVQARAYGKLVSQMVLDLDGEQLSIQESVKYLESLDRRKREEVYHKIASCFLAAEEAFDRLFDDLMSLRHQLAINAGYENFRDYKFKVLGRFDYQAAACEAFHHSVKRQVLPLLGEVYKLRKSSLGLAELKPWDVKVAIEGMERLEPFERQQDLVDKTIACLNAVDPFFGECLAILHKMKHLDLNARKGKQPGGYHMSLLMTGVPFIFMNASNSLKDLVVLTHECGHAIHSFSTRQYQLNSIKSCPSEIAELAAMTMELLAMEHWREIFADPEVERMARMHQLERVMSIFPWVAQIDEFQHWVYVHSDASIAERKAKWRSLCEEYAVEGLDRSGSEQYFEASWHRQLHVFEFPFYYIEYGIAQLGAIAIWKNYRENPVETIERFSYALSLGYSKTIPELYEAAGISFDFSESYIRSNLSFLKEEMEKCYYRVDETTYSS